MQNHLEETYVYMNINGDNFLLVLASARAFDLKLLEMEKFQEIA